MRQFTDRDRRTWQIDLNIGNVFHVKSESDGKFDLLDPTHDVAGRPLQIVLMADLLEFWRLLWLLVEPQAKTLAVTAENFGQSMAAECLVAAQQEFFAEWRDFFLSLRRPDAALSVQSQEKTLTLAVEMVTEKVKQIDQGKLQQKIHTEVRKAVDAAFGTVQASLDAIPGPTPGGNLS
jgi:hypothetical protein